MINNKQSRFKSKVVWTTVISLLLLIVGEFGIWEYSGIAESNVRLVIDSILSILVIFGILNNPTDEDKF